MRNIVLSLAAVAALSAIAAPAAQAQQSAVLAAPQDQDSGASAGAAAPAGRARAAAGGDRVVCMRVNPGASRITRRVCRTQQEWEARGGDEIVDPR